MISNLIRIPHLNLDSETFKNSNKQPEDNTLNSNYEGNHLSYHQNLK